MSRKIIGVTVGSSLPKPNFKQTDPTKGDYIRNKPDFDGLKTDVANISDLVGDTKVSDQISTAVDAIDFPVDSVNGKTGAVQLTASDVGALPADAQIPSENVVHGSAKTLLSNIIDTYILNINYDNLLAFDKTEIVFGSASASTTSVLGQAILGQMVLA